MLTPEQITKEVKAVFGDDVLVDIKFSVNFDGYFIEVSKKVGEEVLMISVCIPAIEELQAVDPTAMLKQYVGYMYHFFIQALEQEKHGNIRLPQRKIGGKDGGPGNGSGTTYH